MIIIRNYKPTDKQSIDTFWEDSFPPLVGNNLAITTPDNQHKKHELLFVAEKSGQIVGSCLAIQHGVRGYINTVTISLEMQQTGIGRKLAKHAIKQLKKIGCNQVKLEVVSQSEQVDQFYQALGFNIIQSDKISESQYQ